MNYDDSESRRISPAALVLVVIVAALIGGVWWINNNGAGGAPQPAKLKSLTPEEIQNMSHKLAEERQKQLERADQLSQGH